VQNGNFWNYDDVVKVKSGKAHERSLAALTAAYPKPRPALAVINDSKAEKLDKKSGEYIILRSMRL
jgi:hypothetical protein